MMRLMCEGGR